MQRAYDLVLRGARILVVDDDPDSCTLLKTVLGSRGATVDAAGDGLAAWHRATERGYDLITMDLWLPLLDGVAATQRIREAGYDLPIVALTACAEMNDRSRCYAAGCTEYLVKPVGIDDLLGVIARCLRAPARRVVSGRQI